MSYQHTALVLACGLARFSPAARSVLLILSHKAQLDCVKYGNEKQHHKGYRPDKSDGWLFLSDEQLRFMSGYAPRQLDNAIKELVSGGVITRPYIAKKGGSKANEYQLRRDVLTEMAVEAKEDSWGVESKQARAAKKREAEKPDGVKKEEARKGRETRRRKAEEQFGVPSAAADKKGKAGGGTNCVQLIKTALSSSERVEEKQDVTECDKTTHEVQGIGVETAKDMAGTASNSGTVCAPVILSSPSVILDKPVSSPPKADGEQEIPSELKETKPEEPAVSQPVPDLNSEKPVVDPKQVIWAFTQIHAALVERGNVATPTNLVIPKSVQEGKLDQFPSSWRACWEFVEDYPDDYKWMVTEDAEYIRRNSYFERGHREIAGRQLDRRSVPTVGWYFGYNARGDTGHDLIEQRKFFKYEEQKVEFRLPDEPMTEEQEKLHRQFYEEATKIFQKSKNKPTVTYEE